MGGAYLIYKHLQCLIHVHSNYIVKRETPKIKFMFRYIYTHQDIYLSSVRNKLILWMCHTFHQVLTISVNSFPGLSYTDILSLDWLHSNSTVKRVTSDLSCAVCRVYMSVFYLSSVRNKLPLWSYLQPSVCVVVTLRTLSLIHSKQLSTDARLKHFQLPMPV